MNQAVVLWNKCLSFIKDNIDDVAFDTWFKPLVPVDLKGKVLKIQVPSKFYYEWIENNYLQLLKIALTKYLGADAKLVYSIKMSIDADKNNNHLMDLPSSNRLPVETRNRKTTKTFVPEIKNPFAFPGIKKIHIDSQLNPHYTFDNFIEGNANRLARNAAMAVAKKPGGTSFNPLLIYGGVGLGKTHLANAIGIEVKSQFPDKTVLYISTEKFIQQYTSATQRNSRNDFIHFYQMIDVLIVDDIQFLSGKPGTQDVFFHIFNHLHQNKKQIILTADKTPVDMQDIEQRLLSRFKWGLSAELQKPDYETRKKIILNKLYADGVKLPENVIEFIAQSIKTNIRELEGIIISLIAHASFDHREINLDLTKEIIQNYVKQTKKIYSIEMIQEIVAKYFNVDIEDIQSKSRKREIVQARQFAMYFAKKITNKPYAEIGKNIGNRNHATVLHACKTIDGLKSIDKEFGKFYKDLEIEFSL
jgi:chromosomal replication initiator protein